jgi:type I restriction enzyme, R subunit
LPAPVEEDLSRGILEAIDMDSYRTEAQTSISIALADEEGEIGPIPTGGIGALSEPEMDRLSNILREFNDLFGNVDWKDPDKIGKVVTEEIPARVSADTAYRNAARNSDRENARIEHNRALQNSILDLSTDHNQLLKRFYDDPEFRRWISEVVFSLTYPEASDPATLSPSPDAVEFMERFTQKYDEAMRNLAER